jgi:superfamily II DNA/RNA helicase
LKSINHLKNFRKQENYSYYHFLTKPDHGSAFWLNFYGRTHENKNIFNYENQITFEALGLDSEICNAVSVLGINYPTPIQAYAIPEILMGNNMVIAAETGVGKTLTYILPILHRMRWRQKHSSFLMNIPGSYIRLCEVLILCPNNLITEQVIDVINSIKDSNGRSLLTWLKLPTKFMATDAPDVVVTTPTALLSFMKTSDRISEKRWFNRDLFISGITHLIIDEVDLSLLGFETTINYLLNIFKTDDHKKNINMSKAALSIEKKNG